MKLRSWAEIERDPALRWFGALLAACHVLALWHWWFSEPLLNVLGLESTPICWPFFEDCQTFRALGLSLAPWLLALYLFGAGAALVAFARKRIALGCIALAVTTLLEVAITTLDYRLRLNQHYMLVWVSAAFVLASGKRHNLMALIVAFYVWAGLLKLNSDWLSGAALLGRRPLFVPESLVAAACAYVVLLELVVVFGLYARRRAIFWAAIAQLTLFHLVSFSIVGFFYPLLMLLLLSLFVLGRAWPRDPAPERPKAGLRLPWMAAFSALQLVPRLYPGDPVLTGQGRWLALHMFDAPVSCRAVAVLHERERPPRSLRMTSRLPARIACDPLVYFHFARAVCRDHASKPGFEDLDLLLDSRRGKNGKLTRVVDLPGFCKRGVSYRPLAQNPWISGE